MHFDLDSTHRRELLESIFEKLEYYYEHTNRFRTNPDLDIQKIRALAKSTDLANGMASHEAIQHVIQGLEEYSVHTPHPKYFGLFNPRANFAGIIADLITATYNPQLAAWSHAPFAAEIEERLIREFATKFGYTNDSVDGVFTTGGAEANLTALLCALNDKYPNFAKEGLFGIDKKPVIFCSEEAHHSIQKAAKVIGMGYSSVRSISTTTNLTLDIDCLLQEMSRLDTSRFVPLMIVGTAGTTGAGTIDDLNQLSQICRDHQVWFHVDAAYGGAAMLSSSLKHLLAGIERSHSITFDAHKWMSIPMGASLFLSSKKNILSKTFRITTEYMPKDAGELSIIDPYTHSIQWSRRFIGLKVYLSLLFFGWKGYEQTIDHQTQIGQYLRQCLLEHDWLIKNHTALPVVCFTKAAFERDPNFSKKVLHQILAQGKSWLSVYPIGGISTLRVCITNYNTSKQDIDELVQELNEAATIYAHKK